MTNTTISNLSKIKPKLRTNGNVTGNFGRPKTKAGSTLNDIGITDREFIHVVTQDEYLSRLYDAFDKADTPRLREFCYTQIRNILIQRGVWCDS